MVALSERFSPRACGPNERIFKLGEILNFMAVVERGAVVLHTTPEAIDSGEVEELKLSPHMYVQVTIPAKIRQELTTGTCFGHEMVYSLVDNLNSTYNVTTLTYSELHILKKQDFLEVIQEFPKAYNALKLYAIRRSWARLGDIPTEDSELKTSNIKHLCL